jgi:hypothetical protein
MQRCQEWPRGYAGDFETIEYMVSGANQSLPDTLGWHIEKISAAAPQQAETQSLEITEAVMRKEQPVYSPSAAAAVWIGRQFFPI